MFFYALGALMTAVGFLKGSSSRSCARRLGQRHHDADDRPGRCQASGTQFTLFAMWFDQEANKELG